MYAIFRNKWLFFGCALVSAGVVLLVAMLGIYVFPKIVADIVDQNMRLDDDNEQWGRFKKLPFPLTFKVYMFDIKNPDDVSKGDLPIVEEKGPYIYKETRNKTILATNSNDTVTFYQEQVFTFDENASYPLKDSDEVTGINIGLWSLVNELEDMSSLLHLFDCIDTIFPKETYQDLFIKRSVRDYIFEGLPCCYKNSTATGLCKVLADTMICPLIKSKKFVRETDIGLQIAYFSYKNVTPDGVYTVNRGRKDITQLGEISQWNYLNFTTFWQAQPNECDHVKGTDSTLYPPRISKTDNVTIYSTDICRSIDIHFMEEGNYKGIRGYKFGGDNNTLYSKNPAQDCFCTEQTKNENGTKSCFLDGVLDIKKCVGAPILLSFPHFLWASDHYLAGVKGLSPPNETIHGTFLHVEPNSGVPLQGNERVQLNTVLRPIKDLSSTKKYPRMVLPVLWIDEGFELPDQYVDQLKSLYFDKIVLLDGVKYGLIGVFSVLTAIFAIIFVNRTCFTD